jgi:D-alanyl-D-alanine carboxypeptidase (penicillin-binding protein 5/6)
VGGFFRYFFPVWLWLCRKEKLMRYAKPVFVGILMLIVSWIGPTPAAMCQAEPVLTLHAVSAVLMDGLTGQVLFSKNPEKPMPPASLTKMMTLYLAFDALKRGDVTYDQEEVISKKAWKMGGSQMFLEVKDKVKFIDLIKGVATISANDGALAIAECLAGSEEVFAHHMNKKAEDLGLKHTHFVNAHGLHAQGQETCALDMATIGFHYINDHPEALEFHSLPTYTYGGIGQRNWNPLLNRGKGVDGLKTGYLRKSGYHILFSAKRDGRRLVGAVMGAEKPEERDNDALKLIGYGFKNFSTQTVVTEGEVVETVKVPGGDPPELGLSAAETLIVTVPKNKADDIPLKKEIPSSVEPPVTRGKVLGRLLLEDEGFPRREVQLVASTDVRVKSYAPHYAAGVVTVAGLLTLGFWRRRKLRRKRV